MPCYVRSNHPKIRELLIARGFLVKGCTAGTVRSVSYGTLTSLMPQTNVRVGRNDPCPCGSGRKYKQCCLAKDEAAAAVVRAKAVEDAAVPAPEAEAVRTASTRAQKPRTEQPWRAKTTRGFVPRSRTPRKVGGS
jgi:SEC-C motif